jgi:sporulation protein YlmC with PRC-barrel domain
MRASDILESRVVDTEGQKVGQVHDIRMVREGPVQGVFGPGYRAQALVVGPAAIGVRLGFDRTNMDGPAILKRFFQWIHRKGRLVDWSLIESITESEIRVRVRREDLPSIPLR